jgi:tetratricopeptide (TPR) repeat protein
VSSPHIAYRLSLVLRASAAHSVPTMKHALFAGICGALFATAQDVPKSEQRQWLQHNQDGIKESKAGRYAAAEQWFRVALLEAESFDPDDPRLSASIANVAYVRGEQGAYDDAERLYRRVLELRERGLGPNSIAVAATLHNLAGIIRLAGRPAEADPLLRRALAIADAAGDERLSATILNTLALTLADTDQKARAEPVLRRCLTVFAKMDGPSSVTVGSMANNLANLYRQAGEFEKAEPLQRRAVEIFEAQLPAGHPLIASGLNNLFSILAQEQRPDDGEPYLRRALEIAEKSAPNGRLITLIHANLAALESDRGNYAVAAAIFKDVIAAQERMLGPDHPLVATSLSNYSGVLRKLHQNGEAKRVEARANAIFRMVR